MKNATLLDQLKGELLGAIEVQMENENISQGEVARRIGSLRNNVNRVLRGKGNASLDFLVKSAESVGLTVEMKVRKSKI